MIPLGVLAGRRSNRGGLAIYHGSHQIGSSTSHTFTAVPIGAADPNRTLILIAAARQNVIVTLGVAVDSTPVTTDIAFNGAANNRHNTLIGHLPHPAGSTADVTVTSSTAAALSLHVYSVIGALALTDAGGATGSGSASRSVAVPGGGVSVAAGSVDGDGSLAVWDWTGANLDGSLPGGSNRGYSCATVPTSGTVTVDSGLVASTGLVTASYSIT